MTTPEETKPQDPKEYWQGFPEAPYSDSFKWTDQNGFEHLSTVRAWTGRGLLTGIEKMTSNIIDLQGKPMNGKAQPAPGNTIPVRDENGTPVVDQDRNPVMTTLPEGVHLFQVTGLAHDKTQTGKDVLKVWTAEEPYNKGYGVSCFHPPAEIGSWKSWPVMSRENKIKYAPPKGFEQVLIRDPKEGSKYADVVEFRAA